VNPLLNEALLLSKSLDSKGCYSWYTYIKYIAQEAGLEITDLEFSGDYNRKRESIKTHFKTCMTNFYKNIFLNKFSTIDNSSKLFLYKELTRREWSILYHYTIECYKYDLCMVLN
jgi:hypothetical protein